MRQNRYHILLWLLFGLPILAIAQESTNPFEMEYRLPESALPTVSEETATVVAEQDTGNPFDIYRVRGNAEKKRIDITNNITPPKKVLKPAKVSDEAFQKSFQFWLLLGMFFALGALVSVFRNTVINIYRAFLNGNYLKLLHRQNVKGSLVPYILLYGLYFLSMGTFIFLTANHFGENKYFNTTYWLGAVLAVAGIYALKHFVLYFIGRVFPVAKEMGQYSFTVMVFSILLGIFLVPITAILMNSGAPMASFVIYTTIGIMVVVLLFRILRSLFLASKYISFHKFHFFMYLCTVEIAPVLILLKIVLLQTGVQ